MEGIVPTGGKAVAFISYYTEEKSFRVAEECYALFRANDIDAFFFHHSAGFGARMSDIKEAIAECDVFVAILSSGYVNSRPACRELGYALELQSKNSGRPKIIGILTAGTDAGVYCVPRDFDSEAPLDPYFFGEWRYFHWEPPKPFLTDDKTKLIDFFADKIVFYGDNGLSETEIRDDVFECYEDLFKDDASRDDPEEIVEWLRIARMEVARGTSPAERSVFAEMRVADTAVGFAYVTIDMKRKWAVINYIGVLLGWRHFKRAEKFWRIVYDRIRYLAPDMKGLILEADPIDQEFVERVHGRKPLKGHVDEEQLLEVTRNIQRLTLYFSYPFAEFRPLALIDAHDAPCYVTQPSMGSDLTTERERDYVLIVLPISITTPNTQEVLTFMYDDFYIPAREARIGYGPYVTKIKQGILSKVEGCRWGRLDIHEKARKLVREAQREFGRALLRI